MGRLVKSHSDGEKVKTFTLAEKNEWVSQCLEFQQQKHWSTLETRTKIKSFAWYSALLIIACIIFSRKNHYKYSKINIKPEISYEKNEKDHYWKNL
jgi:hypothetical protein